jgi:hypothetical protein
VAPSGSRGTSGVVLIVGRWTTRVSARYDGQLTGSYDCVDRIVLKAFFPLGYGARGMRPWWRSLHGDDADLDDTHLMRLAGRHRPGV